MQGFAALEEDWEDLYRDSLAATPFQSWAWLYSWWEFYGKGYELRLITVRDNENLLVGVIPLMLDRKGSFGRLLFVGTGLSDYLDMLARPGWENEVGDAAVWAIGRLGSWQVADLQQLRPDAVAWGIHRRWDGPRTYVWQDGCPVIDVRPWDDLLATLSRNLRSTVRRALRRAESEGVHPRVANMSEAEQAARRLVALHREAWQGRDLSPEHVTQRFESCMVSAARRMIAQGCGGISEFWQEEEVILSYFWVSRPDFVGTYILGASQKALRRYQWSSLYIWDAVSNIARRQNSRHVDLLRGLEPYKLRWSTRVVSTRRLILGRRWTTWMPYAGYHALYSRARKYANSENAPRWVKDAAQGYRHLRREAVQLTRNGDS